MSEKYINNERTKDWLILPILIVSYVSMNLSIGLGLIVLILLSTYRKFRIPKDNTLLVFLIILILGIGMGIINDNGFYNIERDFSYYIGPMIFFVLGIELSFFGNININKLFILYTSIRTFFVFTNLIFLHTDVLFSGNFQNIREYLTGGELIVPLALCLILFRKKFNTGYIGNNTLVFIMECVLLARLIFSFSRAMIISFLIDYFVFLFFSRDKLNIRSISKGILVVFFGVIFIYLSSNTQNIYVTTLFNKFSNIGSEIFSKNNWNDYTNIVQDWRGYETSVAKQVFSDSSVINKLFGSGFGKLFPVLYSDLVGVSETANGITIIHNGYLFNLVKIGILGLFLYIVFFIQLISHAVTTLNKASTKKPILIAYSLSSLVATYVIVGVFQRNFDSGFMLFIGLMYSYGVNKRTINAEV